MTVIAKHDGHDEITPSEWFHDKALPQCDPEEYAKGGDATQLGDPPLEERPDKHCRPRLKA